MKTKNIINEEIKRIKSLFVNSRLHGNIINEEKNKGCIEGDCENGKGTYIYDDGGTYVGDWVDGLNHGHGKYTWPDGDYYEGKWESDVQNGQGIFKKKDGSLIRDGEFKDGKLKSGKEISKDGENVTTKEGEFENGKLKSGTYKLPDGSIYIGDFNNNEKLVKGKYITSNYTDTGIFVNGKLNDKNGERKFSNGCVQTGGFILGQMHGNAKEVCGDVSYKEGEFENGKLNGDGKAIFKNKTRFDGTFIDGIPKSGLWTFADGSKVRGEFDNETLIGKGTYTDSNGKEYENIDNKFISSKKIGCIKGNCYDGNGTTINQLGEYDGNFKDLKFNGTGILNTNISEGEKLTAPELNMELIDITKNLHENMFKYYGKFKDNYFDGKGVIEFSSGEIYDGDFKEGKIKGKGTFTFPNGSSYSGIFTTIPKDNNKSTYNFESIDGEVSIMDLINHNKENSVTIINFDGDNNENKTTVNLKINFTKDNKLFKGNTKIVLVDSVTNKKYIETTNNGTITIPDFHYGYYSYIIKAGGSRRLKGKKTISSQRITFDLNNKNLSEQKIKLNFISEQTIQTNGVYNFICDGYCDNGEGVKKILHNYDSTKIRKIIKGNFVNGKLNDPYGVVYVYKADGLSVDNKDLNYNLKKKIEGNFVNGKLVDENKINDNNTKNNNNIKAKKISLNKIQKDQRDLCKTKVDAFYKTYSNFYSKVEDFSTKNKDEIKKMKDEVTKCLPYYEYFDKKTQKYLGSLTNVKPEFEKYFEIELNINEEEYIYNKTNTMSISNSIKKVIKEYDENKKSLITEKRIINNRLKFVYNQNRKNKRLCMEKLIRERGVLFRSGYNGNLIKESFIDIASTLYGGENNNVLTDLKTKLGQKIADQVKNKETEHDMILNAFNEIPDEIVKKAIDSNDTSLLTSEIANIAIENFKTQFGEDGIGGAFVSSVDPQKFKIEVNKILKPAIESMTSIMGDKVKKIRDIMSGGGQDDIMMSET